MGAVLTSLLIEQRAGIEAVTHYCCRDRNLLGMLSDLLGASAAGVRNLLIITGDPPKMGPYPEATAVFDIDPATAAATRNQLLSRLARENVLIATPHTSYFPALGRLYKEGNGYRWVPVVFTDQWEAHAPSPQK